MPQPLINTPEELKIKIDDYFKNGIKKVNIYDKKGEIVDVKEVATITGLVLHCGYSSRQSFYDLELKDRFKSIIRSARTRIEMHYEEVMQTGNTAGGIFALKNFGWKDKQEVEQKNSGEITVNIKRHVVK